MVFTRPQESQEADLIYRYHCTLKKIKTNTHKDFFFKMTLTGAESVFSI